MEDHEIITRGFSITRKQNELIKKVSHERKLFNISLTLRQIIDEWFTDRYRITEQGREALEAEREVENVSETG
jgi:hypothetical protein